MTAIEIDPSEQLIRLPRERRRPRLGNHPFDTAASPDPTLARQLDLDGDVVSYVGSPRMERRLINARGFVPTPEAVVDLMVASLFAARPPTEDSRVLDPGCGPGAFIDGIVRWCRRHRAPIPRITGIELDRGRADHAATRFRANETIEIVRRDFLMTSRDRFDYIIGNPPYVSIYSFSEAEKAAYRAEYATARGRFDLYLLFFEQALRLLQPNGRLVFITPEKFLYVKTAEPLRRILARLALREVRLVDEETFGSLVTYPAITTVDNALPFGHTKIVLRDHTTREIQFPDDGASALPLLNGHTARNDGPTLDDVCRRVSCGVGLDGSRGMLLRRHPSRAVSRP